MTTHSLTITELKSVSIGYLAADFILGENVWPRRLQIHSRFQHALNLQRDDGYLLTLLCASQYRNLADAIRLDLPMAWDWREHANNGNSRDVTLQENGMLLGAGWFIALENTPCWRPNIITAGTDESPDNYAQHQYPTLVDALNRYCHKHNISSELALLPDISSMKRQPELSLNADTVTLNMQIAQLIGFGRGLTPDGDDYLLGYIASLWRWRNTPRVATHYVRLCRGVAEQLERTNDISRQYLSRGVQGHFSEPICELIQALATAKSHSAISTAASRVMQFGASSGVDCLAGFLHGLRTLSN